MGMKARITLGAVVGVVVIGAVSANAGNDDGGTENSTGKGSSASTQPTPGEKKDGEDKPAEKAKPAVSGDGDYEVGADLKPGTYRSTGNDDGMCYWERAKDASGEMDSILANDNVTGTAYVTIKAGDKVFKSSDCADWEAVDPKAKGTPATKMAGDGGMFAVGTDIAPGTYKSSDNADDSCYWERTKDAEHKLTSIIANDNVNGTAVVTITASDGYFKTSGCTDWTKTG